MEKQVDVLNVQVDAVTMEEALSILEQFIRDGRPHLIATANAEMIMMAQKDRELASVLTQASLVIPDGAGVVWAARYLGVDMPERVAGFDLSQRLLSAAAGKGYKVYLFGGAPGIVDRAKAMAEKQYPGLQIVGRRNGFFTPEEDELIINHIKASQPEILLVGLGVPKQEKWLAKNLARLGVPVVIGVGGTFDVMAGAVKRAPLWMQQANMEWLYRLLSQPQRAIRMLALPRFVWRVVTGKKY
ncbi:glycosyl transferase wecb/taga/cpsf [Lucifera butyrica]|uniref:N-acetylglucosaminyldiphosphoundecaprenol N-acetyl-beta-D-mannosaminyltransferase n=1 Tax=Lucifera butyrica TaxID=1351585 RepID=A0A498R9T2_9FIRM|nr:WecB/TagA/CpsF family glycosyltransferase [Lucifera butyrica]VBB07919.1 glycosyl transferase wecb/taga/cpsf [Lucifera butyrica]